MEQNEKMKHYWKENLTYITILMSIWFAVSYLAGILIANPLDNIRVGGMGLGFWFANQGSEIIFCFLIVIYVQLMNKLDKKYDVHEG